MGKNNYESRPSSSISKFHGGLRFLGGLGLPLVYLYNYFFLSSVYIYIFAIKKNGDVRVLECWCPRICVVRKSNTSKNPGRPSDLLV